MKKISLFLFIIVFTVISCGQSECGKCKSKSELKSESNSVEKILVERSFYLYASDHSSPTLTVMSSKGKIYSLTITGFYKEASLVQKGDYIYTDGERVVKILFVI